ncbi:site-specific integrase [Desemzia sp. C1]|uniref:site-specific integrase n=1 Tax=Desemzia sp. C1 TaxID=2892016 RepID=UPI001E46D8F3|nr:site-specific integrase [Desemzia sp. C1]MCI3029776.1 site-specific integrase [Desemzia sp. C1]
MSQIKKYTKKDGTTAYMFKVYLGINPLTGKQIDTTRRGFKTSKEAKLALSRLKLEAEKGFKVKNKTTFQEVYELWYKSAYESTVKETTRVKTKELFKNHILPAFGSLQVDKITVRYCQEMVNDWCERLVKYKNMKNYTSKVLDYAIMLETINDNPMKKIVVPKREKKVDEEKLENFYSKDELVTFLNCCKNNLRMKWYTLFHLLAYSGFRKSEALALTWNDINFKDNTISITKAVGRGEGNRLYIKDPKNEASERTISIDEVTMNVLREWKKVQAVDLLKLGFNANNEVQLLFSNFMNELVDPNHTVRRINLVIEKNALTKITTHGLRHTHCSLMFESGAKPEVVMERMGHSDIQTTMNIYTHVTKKSKDDTAQKFAEYMNN